MPKCFTASELDYLNQQPEFQSAVASMQTIQDFENTVTVGHKMLVERFGEVTDPAKAGHKSN